MIASLPMYWDAGGAVAWQTMWADVQRAGEARGLELPGLTPPGALPDDWTAHWTDPNLILSQTCSLPFRTVLQDKVRYVGTFDFGLPGFPGAYHSVCLGALPEGHDRPVRLAVNSADSQSGWAAAQDDPALSPAMEIVLTGAHAASAHAVAEGRADIAYLDAVTWRFLAQSTPEIARLPVRRTTCPTPGLPLITAKDRDPAPLRAALAAAVAGASWRGAPALAGLVGFHVLPETDYLALPIPPVLPKPMFS